MSNWLQIARRAFIQILLLFIAQASHAQDAPSPVRCKFGVNGEIRSQQEYTTYLLHLTSEKHQYFDADCDGILTPDQEDSYNAFLHKKIEPQLRDFQRFAQAGKPIKLPDPSTAGVAPQSKPTGWSSGPILRDSFADVSVFSAPKDVKLASGASFGWTKDSEVDNTSWSAKGLAGYSIVWRNPDNPIPKGVVDPYLAGLAIAPTVSFNRLTHSNTKLASKAINILTVGGTSEFAIGHLGDETTLHFFRARGSLVGDFDGELKSWTSGLEYQPVNELIGSPNGLGGLPATFQIDAIARGLFAERVGNAPFDPLFANADHLFRAGATLALAIAPQQGPDSPVPALLQRFNFTTTYSWLHDLDGADDYSIWSTAVGFALDDKGNVGVKVGYDLGKLEETGQSVDMAKVTLTAKY